MATDLPHPPGLASFRSILPSWPVEKSIEYLISLLRRRQIRGPKQCALATAWLLRKVVSTTRASEPGKLISRVQDVGKKLVEAAPRELAVGNIVRRVLGAIREEEENRENGSPGSSDVGSIPPTPAAEMPAPPMSASTMFPRREDSVMPSRPALLSQQTGTPERRPPVTSMFSILSHPTMRGQAGTGSPGRSGSSTPAMAPQTPVTDFRAEVLEAITEIVDELDQADEQVAGYALEHISPQETIFTYSTSAVVQRFLLKAATKRKFTVIQAESYPNNHKKTHASVMGSKLAEEDGDLDFDSFSKPLTAQGVTVLLIPDSAIFAMMSRANKVIIPAYGVLSNGSIVAEAGARALTTAAKWHRVPVIVLAETYKLSPLFPYDPFDFVDYGDMQKVVEYQDREMQLGLQSVKNPVTEFVEAANIDLFITNLGGVATGYMYRTIRDQYHDEDLEL
ncbi:GCD complex subunit gcd7 [Knufia obscura]|uniref:Translation initiation factor eIF2B subunit beta n=2 Tax=Knufia TaxID=430999 RepID=A0AAN8EFX5_9EURO|nr:GCD complex subunit gcd7 [Knufia obscura]KAK5954839.1 GCD complex subunit gcd7 [Knufia fluminis]